MKGFAASRLRAGELRHVCPRCGELGLRSPDPERSDYYPESRDADGTPHGWQSYCVACNLDKNKEFISKNPDVRRRLNRATYQRMKSDPVRLERYRTRNREHKQRRAATDAEYAERRKRANRESAKRRYYELRADPKRWEEYLRKQREAYHARARAQGVQAVPGRRRYPEPTSLERPKRLPVEPLAAWLEGYLRGDAPEDHEKALATPARRMRGILNGEQKTVRFDTADRMLTLGGGPRIDELYGLS